MNPLLEGRDELAGKHANTQIPKVIGEARLYEVAGDKNGQKIAENFWDAVVHHHSYVIGGNSESEHFWAARSTGESIWGRQRRKPATPTICSS